MKRVLALMLSLLMLSACTAPASQDGRQDSQPEISSGQDERGPVTLSAEQTDEISQMVLQSARCISDEFSSGQNIPVYELTRFLYERMKLDGVDTGFEQSADALTVSVPIDQVRSYAKAYFGIEELKIDFMSQQYFDGQYITIPLPDEEEPKLPYELAVLRVETVGSRISAVLGLRSGDVLFQQWNYTLRADKKGNVYFESMLKRPVEYGLYAINGPVGVVTTLMGLPVSDRTLGGFQFSPMGEGILCWISNGRQLRIGFLDLQTYKSEQYITLEGQGQEENDFSVQVSGDQIFVYQRDRITVLDQNLITVRTILYPQEMLALCDEETTDFALSPDLTTLAFNDSDGVNAYNLETKDWRQLIVHPASGASGVNSYWRPVEWNARTGVLLLEQATRKGSAGFAAVTIGGSRKVIDLTGDKDTRWRVSGERLMVFDPQSADKELLLPDHYAEYNLATGSYKVELGGGARMPETTDMWIGEDKLFFADRLKIGRNMVNSYSIRAVDKAGTRQTTPDFGYVDKQGKLSFKAVSSGERIVAACSGVFLDAIVII